MFKIGKSIQLKFAKFRNYVILCTECMINTIKYPAKIFCCYGNKYDINTCLFFNINYSICPLPSMIGFKKIIKEQLLIYIVYLTYDIQGCGNTMLDLSDLVPFHSGQVENLYLLVLGQVQCIKLMQFSISYFD